MPLAGPCAKSPASSASGGERPQDRETPQANQPDDIMTRDPALFLLKTVQLPSWARARMTVSLIGHPAYAAP
jgi:hypothetical protein